MSGIKNVVVVGGGFMGSQIAQVSAQNGFDTWIVDVSEEALQRSREYLNESLDRVKHKMKPQEHEQLKKSVFSRLKFTTNLEEAARGADLVVEVIPENVRLKQELLQRLERICPKHTIFATNTSTLQLKRIAEKMQEPGRFGGLHYFFPVPIVSIVEVVKADRTSEETFRRLLEFTKEIKKIPIRCKDTPGFIVNRILIPQQNAALELVDAGVATFEEIDVACEKALGLPLGPFKLMDHISLETAKLIRDSLMQNNPELHVVPSFTLDRLVQAGHFGQKTGRGFYAYGKKAAKL